MTEYPFASKHRAAINWCASFLTSGSALDRTEAEIERNGFGKDEEPAEPEFAFGATWKPVFTASKLKMD